jgi:hypothetical protein
MAAEFGVKADATCSKNKIPDIARENIFLKNRVEPDGDKRDGEAMVHVA